MRFRTIVRGAAQWGALCGVFAVLVFVGGCPMQTPCTGVDCSDDDLCTVDTCTVVENEPVCSNEPVDCADQVCDPETGDCVDCVADAGCDDGLYCNGAETCDMETMECLPGIAPCTEGQVCFESSGECRDSCTASPDCDDGNPCTVNTCTENVCLTTTLGCNDNNACTADSCDPATGCVNDPIDCDDGDACTDDTCDPATGCVNDPIDCDDGDLCTTDTCDAGVCANTPVECPAGQACDAATGDCVDACVSDADCDDGNLCTTDDCTVDGCVNDPVVCDQGQSCNPATGNCEDIECTSNADCDDGFSCTLDKCNLSTNECGYTPVDEDCIDGLYCNGVEFCDPTDADAEEGTGCVIPGNPCSGGTPVCDEANNECDPCTSDGQCDDGFDCTLDTCEGGPCLNNPRHTECDDGLYCTATDECLPEDDDADERGCVNRDTPCDCDTVACGAGAVAGDHLICSETENDGAGGCVPCTGEAQCDDDIPCTVDVCNAAAPRYCSNDTSDAACPDPVFCDGEDVCNPDDPDADFNGCVPPAVPACDNPLPICDEANEECLICESNAECNEWDGVDDDLCTLTKCNVVGVGECSNEPVDCDDADACTADSCDPATGDCVNAPEECTVVGDCPIGCNTACTGGLCE